MMFIDNINKKELINDLIKITTILLIVHILLAIQNNKTMFNEESIYLILYFLIGVSFYHIVIVNLIPPIE